MVKISNNMTSELGTVNPFFYFKFNRSNFLTRSSHFYYVVLNVVPLNTVKEYVEQPRKSFKYSGYRIYHKGKFPHDDTYGFTYRNT